MGCKQRPIRTFRFDLERWGDWASAQSSSKAFLYQSSQ
jgi:hypothetical protein